MWESNKIYIFHNQKLKKSIFMNATKYLKIVYFKKNIYTWKYFMVKKYFSLN